MSVQLHFLNEDIRICVPAETSLLEAQRLAGLIPDAPCGGKGTCGKCIVDIRTDPTAPWQRVKACAFRADRDLTVRTLSGKDTLQILNQGEASLLPTWNPWVQAIRLQLDPCSAGVSTSNWHLLTSALNRAVAPQNWHADTQLLAGLGDLIRCAKGTVWAYICEDRILALSESHLPIYMAAFDLGTTSLAGYLVNETGTVARAGMPNPQAQFGADVILRANHAVKNGVEALTGCVREALDDLLGQLCDQAGILRQQIMAVSLVGNTCMHHLFLAITPSSLVSLPYSPTFRDAAIFDCADYGLHAHPNARLLMLPVIAGFVGADTVGCLLACDWEHREKITLMIDIGTNGELVLGNRYRMIACSTAAGPAFEGALISCGMRGTPGAIDHVRLEDGIIRYSVIGDGKAEGLCGSGLIDLIAVLLKTEKLDSSGRMNDGKVFHLEGTEVSLTQKDVRQVQLAKAAIYAGIHLLAQSYGIPLQKIEEVLIAGAFGTYMDPDSACAISLIPAELRDRIRPIGNAAGEGAKLPLMDRSAWDCACRLADQTEFLELASFPDFQDTFVDSLEFFE
jgi:uncharacterized 2Fe-2S/4Fe-4S cluster protein (DUF4445 family)